MEPNQKDGTVIPRLDAASTRKQGRFMSASDLQHQLDRTKIALMANREATFYTAIIMSLKFFWDEDHPTAWTDGYRLAFNPEFFLSLPELERLGVMVHEASHVALDHMGRLMGRTMKVWNKAADHNINLYLEERGFKLPSFRLADPRFKGMSTDQIYDILIQEGDDEPNPMEDIRIDDTVMTDEYKRHIEDIIIRAATVTRMSNTPDAIPGEVQLFLQKLLKPRLPWQTILRREAQEATKTGHSWMKPNRRYFPKHHLPTAWSMGPQDATFYVDISCSVSDAQFNIFVSEIVGSLRMFNFRKMTIVQFDTEIKSIDEVKNLRELMNVKFSGRGGTHIGCILDHIEKTKPSLAIVFTDGGFYWPRQTFRQRILWLINDNPSWKPLFGRAIHFHTNT